MHFNDSDGSSATGGPSWERVASRLGASNAAAPSSMAPAAAGPARLGMGDLLLERCTSISIVKKAPRSSQGLLAGQRAATLGPPGTRSPLRPPAGEQASARSSASPSRPPTDAGSSQQGSSRRCAPCHFHVLNPVGRTAMRCRWHRGLFICQAPSSAK